MPPDQLLLSRCCPLGPAPGLVSFLSFFRARCSFHVLFRICAEIFAFRATSPRCQSLLEVQRRSPSSTAQVSRPRDASERRIDPVVATKLSRLQIAETSSRFKGHSWNTTTSRHRRIAVNNSHKTTPPPWTRVRLYAHHTQHTAPLRFSLVKKQTPYYQGPRHEHRCPHIV
jgi:hypothetical protein